MNILEIYKQYQIMPQLITHQLKVAAVAEMILDNITPQPPLILRGGDLDRENIISACLLHDMGNIVKFDLSKTNRVHPHLVFKPEEEVYWEKVRQDYIQKYGSSSHEATINIIKELGAKGRISELVDCIGFEQGKNNAASTDYGKKICAYADMRVMPRGICSLEERFSDLRIRYAHHREGPSRREEFEDGLREIEKQIFRHCDAPPAGDGDFLGAPTIFQMSALRPPTFQSERRSKIKPEDITEESIKGKLEILRYYEI